MNHLRIANKKNKHLEYSKVNNEIRANGQEPMEFNPDSRISRIWKEILDLELEVSYMHFGSVKEIKLARKSDDPELWMRCQPRTNSNSPEERIKDEAVKNRAHLIVSDFQTNEWKDFNNPPLGFKFKDRWWFILGNGRVASLIKAEEMLKEIKGEPTDIPFSFLCLDLSVLSLDERNSFVLSCSQIGNSKTGEEVESETSEQIETALKNYWEEILLFAKQESRPFVGSYYAPALEIYKSKILTNKKEENSDKAFKEAREAVSHYFLEKEKRNFDPSSRGRIISKVFDDHNTVTGDRYDSGRDFGELIASLWDDHFSTENSFSNVELGWKLQESEDGSKFYNVFTTTTSERNLFLPIAEHSKTGDGREAHIIHNPYSKDDNGKISGPARVSVDTRQTNIIKMLNMARDWNTCNLRINGKGVLIRTFIFPRMIDHTASDCDGNQDCDIVYFWAGSHWKRQDNGLFGLNEKLPKELPKKEERKKQDNT